MVNSFGEGEGPIFLQQLGCEGTESLLLDCPRFTGLGLTTCDHSEDAGVRCIGELGQRTDLLFSIKGTLSPSPF